ncbi:MAG: DUF4043 family protein [Chloroflexi bacterium]|nr:DUF4043 family protein [Chloroflexota bacterium]
MTMTTTPTETTILKWRRSFIREWSRDNLFSPYMGKASEGTRSVIHQVMEFKDAGETVNLPMVAALSGSGVTGSTTLQGSEEAMDQYGHDVTVDWKRNAVALNKKEQRKSAADQLAIVRPLLNEWAGNELRDDIIEAFHSIDGTVYASANAAARNTWLTNNADRALFGALVANAVSNVHATALATLDNTADKMSTTIQSTAKRLAKAATPKIRPVKVNGGREYFVHFMGGRAFRDLKADPVMTAANREARVQDVGKNPIFQDGDLIHDGIISVEVPEIDDLVEASGAGSIDVAPSFLCGAQALGHGIGQLPMPTTRSDTDYGFIKGRGVEMCYGVNKIQFNGTLTSDTDVDWGMVTLWTAAVADG